ELRRYEYSPLFQIQKWSGFPAHQPLFENVLAFENYPISEAVVESGQKIGSSDVRSYSRTNYPLLAAVIPASRIWLKMVFDGGLYSEEAAGRMLGHWRRILENLAEGPDRPLHGIGMLSAPERHQLLVEWNDTGLNYPRQKVIADVFRQQAGQRPDSVALVFADRQLSYAELERRSAGLASVLASLLAGRRFGPEPLVGLLTERSPEMIIGLLGILRSGAAYLPFDPGYPRERLSFMLADSKAAAVLCSEGLQDRLPAGLKIRTLLLGETCSAALPQGQGVVCRPVHPESLAYVMYTSGSTGLPKGVGITQRGVLGLLAASFWVPFNPDQTVMQLAPISFDHSGFQIWGCLLNGGRLVLFASRKVSLQGLGRAVEQYGVTVLTMFSLLFQQMVEEQLPVLRRLSMLSSGGDVLPPSHARRALEGGVARLANHYGPTECTVQVCCQVFREPGQWRSVPIGPPIANSQVFVLDRNGKLTPMGVVGELCLGGDGLARCYLGSAARTAQGFVPNRFGRGARFYRSGDLARWLLPGTIEFLGRFDRQVKIRGFRVEPGEVESLLCGHQLVERAVVEVRGKGAHRRLAAFVVFKKDAAAGNQLETLRDFLKQRLPEYMLPSALVALQAMPCMSSGKIDRRALPQDTPSEAAAGEGHQQPVTPTEELLAGIWCQVLEREKVGRGDDFFQLGGHSLLATQAVSRIRRAFDVELPLRELFEAPTLKQLARRIEDYRRQGSVPAAAAPAGGVREGEAPLSFAQRRMWFLQQIEPGSSSYNVPRNFRLTGRLKVAALRAGLDEIVRRHEVLRTAFPARDGKPVQFIRPPSAFPFPMVDLEGCGENRAPKELLRLASEEAMRPFDLETGPMLRACLVRLGRREHAVLATLHHIVTDAWSAGVLVKELTTLYEAFASGLPSPLAPLSIQYADFARHQRSRLNEEVVQQQISYWKRQLRGVAESLPLPTDRPRPEVLSGLGESLSFEFPEELLQSLQQLSRDQDVTLFMTLMTAYQTLLYWLSGRQDIHVATPIANRTIAETEGLIGYFINTLVLRMRFSKEVSFAGHLRRLRETALGAYANQDLPFDQLVDVLKIKRSLSRQPLSQVMFTFQNAPTSVMRMPGLTLRSLGDEDATAKRDLTLLMWVQGSQLAGLWIYSTDLYDASTAAALSRRFQGLLESVSSHSEISLQELRRKQPGAAKKTGRSSRLEKLKAITSGRARSSPANKEKQR
ncbi:MAG: amino acid adenylation domain-containing protein, partial [Acidobacteriota bacterium]